jgi:hypothetical protein
VDDLSRDLWKLEDCRICLRAIERSQHNTKLFCCSWFVRPCHFVRGLTLQPSKLALGCFGSKSNSRLFDFLETEQSICTLSCSREVCSFIIIPFLPFITATSSMSSTTSSKSFGKSDVIGRVRFTPNFWPVSGQSLHEVQPQRQHPYLPTTS